MKKYILMYSLYSHLKDRDNSSLARAAILLLFHSELPDGERIFSRGKLILPKEFGNFKSCCQYGPAVMNIHEVNAQ